MNGVPNAAGGVEIDFAAAVAAADKIVDVAHRVGAIMAMMAELDDTAFLDTGKDDAAQLATWYVPQAHNCHEVVQAVAANCDALGTGAKIAAADFREHDEQGRHTIPSPPRRGRSARSAAQRA